MNQETKELYNELAELHDDLILVRRDTYVKQDKKGNYKRVFEKLTDKVLINHFKEKTTIAHYPTSLNDTTKTLTFDIDHYPDNRVVVVEILTALRNEGVSSSATTVAFSGNINGYGSEKYHVCVYMPETAAYRVKEFGNKIMDKVYSVIGKPTDKALVVEVNPKSDHVDKHHPGYPIKLEFCYNNRGVHRSEIKHRSRYVDVEINKKLDLKETVELLKSRTKFNLPEEIDEHAVLLPTVKDEPVQLADLYEDENGHIVDRNAQVRSKPNVPHIEGKTENTKVNSTPIADSEAHIKLIKFLQHTTEKYCYNILIKEGIQLNGAEGNKLRWCLAYDMAVQHFKKEVLYEAFKSQNDFNLITDPKQVKSGHSTYLQVEELMKYIEKEKEKKLQKKFGARLNIMSEAEKAAELDKIKLHTTKCDTLRDECGSYVKPYCSGCLATKEIVRMFKKDGNFSAAVAKSNVTMYKPIWEEVQKIGFKSGDDYIEVYSITMNKLLSDYGFEPKSTRDAWYSFGLIEGKENKDGLRTTVPSRLPGFDKPVKVVRFFVKSWNNDMN